MDSGSVWAQAKAEARKELGLSEKQFKELLGFDQQAEQEAIKK